MKKLALILASISVFGAAAVLVVMLYGLKPASMDGGVVGRAGGDRPGQDEYMIDPSDMYSVDAAGKEAVAIPLGVREQEWLVRMREEEKLARDVYTTLGNTWGVPVFSNIAGSEQTHMDSMKTLLDRYGIADPVADDSIGSFSSPEMGGLYAELTAKGSQSLLDALVVGATVEDLDIADLDKALPETSEADIKIAYENLQKGSRNHMRAFVKNISQRGGAYAPRYISTDDYRDILSSPQERGRISK